MRLCCHLVGSRSLIDRVTHFSIFSMPVFLHHNMLFNGSREPFIGMALTYLYRWNFIFVTS